MVYFAVMVIIIGSGLLIYMAKEAFADRVIYNELSFPNFPKSFGEVKIFFISDIHKRSISRKIIQEILLNKADIVIIGGDLMEKGVPFERVKNNLLQLKEIGPVYFVWGNNDYEVNYRELDALLLDCGVKILDNTAVFFESEGGDRLILMGIDDLTAERDRLDLALADAGEGGFKVLVSHHPAIAEKIEKDQNISLVLSGHTHGGQIRIFGFGPYEKGTVKKLPGTAVLTSNGYGTTGLPLRLGAQAETHLITLKNG